MKKVLIISNDTGGLYRFRRELISELTKSSEVIILSPLGNKTEEIKSLGCTVSNIKLDRRGVNPLKDFLLVVNYFLYFKRVKPDYIISFTIKPNVYGGIVTRILHIPFFPYVAGLGTPFQKNNIKTKVLIVMHRIAFKKSSVVFFENSETLDYYKSNKIVKNNIKKLPGAGVNLSYFSYCNMPKCSNTNFIFIGRIMKEKGINELIDASIRIKQQYPESTIYIAGPYEEDFKDRLNELMCNHIIEYVGVLDDIRGTLAACHCLILPSYHEGMANVLLESAAMGRIIITSNIHGCLEAVDEGKNGYLVEPKNSEALYEAMKKVILLDDVEREKMGRYSRLLVETGFSRDMVVNMIMNSVFGNKTD